MVQVCSDFVVSSLFYIKFVRNDLCQPLATLGNMGTLGAAVCAVVFSDPPLAAVIRLAGEIVLLWCKGRSSGMIQPGRWALPALACLALCGAAQAETWLEDEETGCRVWSPDPAEPGDVLTWSGGCLGGHAEGEGTLVLTNNGAELGRYEGTMSDGRFEGEGNLKTRESMDDGFVEVRASFAEGLPQGYGELDLPDGSTYRGDFNKGEFHGFGTYVEADGDRYEGQFKDGKPHGAGSFTGADGEEYSGDFFDGERAGLGILIGAVDGVYLGEFSEGMPSGSGVYEDGTTGRYHGQFANGQPHGFGSYVAADGRAYQGRFADGKLDGLVLVTEADGTARTETWKDGAPVK